MATNASASDPVPRPISTPQHSTSCQLAVMNTVAPLPTATVTRAADTTRRMPNRSIRAAANGAVSPYSSRFTDTAEAIVPRGQPNSWCSGSSSTPGVARKPAAATSVTRVAAATGQARCSRRVRDGGGVIVVDTPIMLAAGWPRPRVARWPLCDRIRP